MTRSLARFKQSDVTCALRAARAAGLEVSGYEVDPIIGKIVVTTTNSGAEQKPETELDK